MNEPAAKMLPAGVILILTEPGWKILKSPRNWSNSQMLPSSSNTIRGVVLMIPSLKLSLPCTASEVGFAVPIPRVPFESTVKSSVSFPATFSMWNLVAGVSVLIPTRSFTTNRTPCAKATWGDESLEGRTIAIIGDIAHSRVARSNLYLLTKLGAKVIIGGPRSLVPPTLELLGATIIRDVDEIIQAADAVMVLRVQFERMVGPPPFPSLSDYNRAYGLTVRRAKLMKSDAFVMHPGPMNRGIEIDPEVADGPTSVVAHQVRNGIAARMAVLERAVRQGPWRPA